MAAQKVQAYLERHRIGALFEDLMAKVIKDTPEDPIAYLIKVLKRLYSEGSKGPGSSLPPSGSKTSFARSMGLTGTSVGRHSFDEGRSVLAKSWAGPDSHIEGSKFRPGSASKATAGRDYPRPWLSGSKPGKTIEALDRDNTRPPPRKAHTHNENEKPPWNAKTAVPSHDFDEWFNMQPRQPRTTDEDFRDYQGTSSWGRNGEIEMPAERTVIYNRQAPSASPMYYADDSLEAELNMGRDIKIQTEGNDSSSVASYESTKSRKQKARHAAEEHRRELQALLLNKNPSKGSVNGINDDEDLHDDGTELLENVDELESEGVSNLHSTGARLPKSMKQGTAASESVRVSICARCAKIITGQPSDRKSDAGSVCSASEVDDNFDSVSQVGSSTGRNRSQVWPSGFDSESDSSPRKGQHMWQSPSRSPVKGKHMFRGGSFTADHPDSSRPPTASSSRSDLVYSGRQQKSWNFDGYSSDNDTEVNYDRVGSPELGGSRPWNRALVESGSEADWDTAQASPLRSSAPDNLRRSGSFGKSGRNLAASFDSKSGKHTRSSSSNATIGNIENEYIRNLQQQIYFLELEANYLREQARKASAIPPRVTEEADRMMRKLRDLQAQVDERSSDVVRKETQMNMLEAEKDATVKRLRDAEESHAVEKRQLVNEIVSLKKMSDLHERDCARRDLQVHQYKNEADKGLTALQEAERKVQNYRIELDHKTEDLNNLRIELEEKRAECLKLKTQLQEMDDKYFDSQAKTKEELGRALREEIRQLRLQLKEKEINAEQDRSLRNKIQDDCTALIKENAAISAQVVELRKQIDMDRAHKDEKDFRRHANIQELVTLKESEKHLQQELERTKELLKLEQQNHRETIAKLSREEQASLEANLRRTQLRNELNEVEGHQDSTNSENVALKRDKLLLTDEVANLNAKLDERDEEIDRLKLRLEDSESRCSHLESKVRMQRSLESVKWEEFEKLATTMREFSRSMSPSKSGSLADY